MKRSDTGKVQDKILNRIERQEKRQAFQRDRFLKFKLPVIHNKLFQTLLLQKVIETDNPTAVSDSLLRGLQKAQKSSEFDFKYFIAPIRSLVPRPNPYSLFITQYIMEVMINDPDVIEVYGTDEEIYRVVNEVISRVNIQFERAEEEIVAQLARNKSLKPGSRDYDIALDQLFRQKMGEPQAQV
jgi:hypothetical protein